MKLGPFTLTEKHWLKVFEYRVLRKLFGPKRVEIIGKSFVIKVFMIFTIHQAFR